MAQVQINMDIQEIVNIVSQLNNTDLGNFKEEIDEIWRRRNGVEISDTEQKLIAAIQSKVTKKEFSRYELLNKKVDLTEIEEKERAKLFAKSQKDYARRIEIADELAKLKGLPFKEILKNHGLLNTANV